MAEGSRVFSEEEVVLVNVKKLRQLGVTQRDDEIRQVLSDVGNDLDKALSHLQANGKENHEMEVETVPNKEDEIVVVEDHFGDAGAPPMEGGEADLPPPYEEAAQAEETTEKDEPPPHAEGVQLGKRKLNISSSPSMPSSYDPELQFPVTNFYELEGRVHADSWSIPVRKDESLAKCLKAAIRLAKAEALYKEDSCKKFMEKTLPEVFEKLMTSDAVLRWESSVQEGILDMTRLLVELVAEQLKQPTVPHQLLEIMTNVFNADINFHVRNRARRVDSQIWHRRLSGQVFAVSPSFTSFKDPKGWLVELMNTFAYHGGVDAIRGQILSTESLSVQDLTSLFQPFGVCDEYINTTFFKDHFGDCVTKAVKFVEKMTEADLKQKEVGSVSVLLKTLKTVCLRVWSHESAQKIDQVRLDITLRMLKTPHFNAKMNALKEVVKLIEEPSMSRSRGVKNPISKDRILEWLVENKVLSIALSGNLHQTQYTDKLKSILETIGTRLSLEELDTIWEHQVDKTPVQVENIHNVLAAGAPRFTPRHLDRLFLLIQQSWENASDRYRERLLHLIGKIGRDDRTGKTANKILELLWSMAHTPQLSPEMAEQALDAHCSILVDSTHSKDAERKVYIGKCVEDIKKMTCVVPAFRHLHRIMKGISRNNSRSYQSKEQLQISDLRKQYDLLKMTTSSLVKWQTKAAELQDITPELLVDGRYQHWEFVSVHLQFLAFLAQDGGIYLPLKRAAEVWDVLIQNPNSCADDRTRAFRWFDQGIVDVDVDSQSYLFVNRMLKMDPMKLDWAGYKCFKNYFETVNLSYRKLRKMASQNSTSLIVETVDVIGGDYLWQACLEVADEEIASDLISDILHISYSGLDSKLKRNAVALHRRFLENCHGRIKTILDKGLPKDPGEGVRPQQLQALERLLVLMQRYITMVEDAFHLRRTMPPHGTCFQGDPLTLFVRPENEKQDFRLECHSNECWRSIRQRVARRLKVPVDQLQLGTAERWLNVLLDNRLLRQLGLKDEQDIIVKKLPSTTLASLSGRNGVEEQTPSNQAAIALEQEKVLPGVMVSELHDIFLTLEQLANIGDTGITAAVRSLQMLVPTDRRVLEEVCQLTQDSTEDLSVSHDVIQRLFDPAKNSPMQLLYTFEVLSGQILPVHEVDSRETSAQDFRKQFLRAGGLTFVINILQRNALPQDVDINIRQDCYAIALFLARFLLCNETSLPSLRTAVLKRGSSINTSANPEAMSAPPQEEYEDVSDGDEMVTDIDAVISDKGDSLTPSAPQGGRSDEVARLTIEMMSVDDFTTMLAYLVRVAWAAAAGQLHLASTPDGTDADGDMSRLQGGVCAMQKDVSSKDAAVAREALELLVTCLQLRRSLLGVFMTMACVGDFVIDILLGCAHAEVRTAAAGLFYRLCQRGPMSPSQVTINGEQLPVKKMKVTSEDEPRKFFIHLLLQARVPLWAFSLPQKEDDMRLWERCSSFFDLICWLLEGLSIEQQQVYSVDTAGLLCSETTLMEEVCKYRGPTSQMQKLISGHLNLLKALVTCEGVNKHSCGPKLVNQVLDYFLFPASNLMAEGVEPPERGDVEISPRCEEVQSQVSAYRLLTVLAVGSVDNLAILSQRLVQLHLTEKPEMAKEWEFHPPVIGRAQCGFVGLRNAGATCYMNSVLQQLYMQPAIREMVMTADVEESGSEDDQSIFPEFQSVFGHLMQSRLQCYSPDGFWKKFKLWGNPVNVREQQDAFEFFSNLTDQVDEVLKKNKLPQVFQKTLGGVFLDQKLCRGCEHKYEREEPFLSLSLTISTNVMHEALKEFVKGEWLEGDNAYFCEKCQEKRDTLKRTCIKTLPPVLVIHLKRFGYDWEAGRAIKCDDHFEFPWSIDMRPYTAEGMRTSESEDDMLPRPLNYELVGIVVHSGQASAGHYYSYIRQRRPKDAAVSEEDVGGAGTGMWYRFNDTVVEEFEMSEESMEAECFGGVYKSAANIRQDMRTRFWSAYMLFYEAVDPVPVEPDSVAHQEPTGPTSIESPMITGGRDLSELTALVRKGEERVVFHHPSMPSAIQRRIHDENLQFMQHKEVYTPGYFTFIKELVDANMPCLLDQTAWRLTEEERDMLGLASFKLAVHFLLHMYCRTRKKLRSCISREQWLTTLHHLMRACPGASVWMLRYLGNPPGSALLKTIFLDCPIVELRLFFSKLLCLTLQTHFDHGGTEEDPVDKVLNELLALLEREVVECYKNAAQYFDFMREYGGNFIGGPHLIRKDALMRFLVFLLGPPSTKQRQWVPQQVREFRPVFAAISNLLRMTDLTFACAKNVPDAPPNPYSFQGPLLPPSLEFQEWFTRQEDTRKFIKECVLALREADAMTTEALASSLCCCSYYNESFSALVLDDLLQQTATHASNELKQSYKVLTDIMLVADPLQVKRIKYVMEGSKSKPDYGLFNVMSENKNHDSRRTYLAVKCLVNLANRCDPVREVIMRQTEKWQWSVTWLKKKMKEHYSAPSQTATIVSNDTTGQRSTFQRTISAQNTLEEATELLSEIESHEKPKSVARQPSGSVSSAADDKDTAACTQEGQDSFAG